MRRFKCGDVVILLDSVGQIPAGVFAVVKEVLPEGGLGDYLARCCGLDLILFEGQVDVDESIGNTETSGRAGGASESSSIAGAANGESDKAGALDGGADAGAKPYSVAQAVSDLEALAVGVGFEKDEYILDIAGKLKTIAA